MLPSADLKLNGDLARYFRLGTDILKVRQLTELTAVKEQLVRLEQQIETSTIYYHLRFDFLKMLRVLWAWKQHIDFRPEPGFLIQHYQPIHSPDPYFACIQRYIAYAYIVLTLPHGHQRLSVQQMNTCLKQGREVLISSMRNLKEMIFNQKQIPEKFLTAMQIVNTSNGRPSNECEAFCVELNKLFIEKFLRYREYKVEELAIYKKPPVKNIQVFYLNRQKTRDILDQIDGLLSRVNLQEFPALSSFYEQRSIEFGTIADAEVSELEAPEHEAALEPLYSQIHGFNTGLSPHSLSKILKLTHVKFDRLVTLYEQLRIVSYHQVLTQEPLEYPLPVNELLYQLDKLELDLQFFKDLTLLRLSDSSEFEEIFGAFSLLLDHVKLTKHLVSTHGVTQELRFHDRVTCFSTQSMSAAKIVSEAVFCQTRFKLSVSKSVTESSQIFNHQAKEFHAYYQDFVENQDRLSSKHREACQSFMINWFHLILTLCTRKSERTQWISESPIKEAQLNTWGKQNPLQLWIYTNGNQLLQTNTLSLEQCKQFIAKITNSLTQLKSHQDSFHPELLLDILTVMINLKSSVLPTLHPLFNDALRAAKSIADHASFNLLDYINRLGQLPYYCESTFNPYLALETRIRVFFRLGKSALDFDPQKPNKAIENEVKAYAETCLNTELQDLGILIGKILEWKKAFAQKGRIQKQAKTALEIYISTEVLKAPKANHLDKAIHFYRQALLDLFSITVIEKDEEKSYQGLIQVLGFLYESSQKFSFGRTLPPSAGLVSREFCQSLYRATRLTLFDQEPADEIESFCHSLGNEYIRYLKAYRDSRLKQHQSNRRNQMYADTLSLTEALLMRFNLSDESSLRNAYSAKRQLLGKSDAIVELESAYYASGYQHDQAIPVFYERFVLIEESHLAISIVRLCGEVELASRGITILDQLSQQFYFDALLLISDLYRQPKPSERQITLFDIIATMTGTTLPKLVLNSDLADLDLVDFLSSDQFPPIIVSSLAWYMTEQAELLAENQSVIGWYSEHCQQLLTALQTKTDLSTPIKEQLYSMTCEIFVAMLTAIKSFQEFERLLRTPLSQGILPIVHQSPLVDIYGLLIDWKQKELSAKRPFALITPSVGDLEKLLRAALAFRASTKPSLKTTRGFMEILKSVINLSDAIENLAHDSPELLLREQYELIKRDAMQNIGQLADRVQARRYHPLTPSKILSEEERLASFQTKSTTKKPAVLRPAPKPSIEPDQSITIRPFVYRPKIDHQYSDIAAYFEVPIKIWNFYTAHIHQRNPRSSLLALVGLTQSYDLFPEAERKKKADFIEKNATRVLEIAKRDHLASWYPPLEEKYFHWKKAVVPQSAPTPPAKKNLAVITDQYETLRQKLKDPFRLWIFFHNYLADANAYHALLAFMGMIKTVNLFKSDAVAQQTRFLINQSSRLFSRARQFKTIDLGWLDEQEEFYRRWQQALSPKLYPQTKPERPSGARKNSASTTSEDHSSDQSSESSSNSPPAVSSTHVKKLEKKRVNNTSDFEESRKLDVKIAIELTHNERKAHDLIKTWGFKRIIQGGTTTDSYYLGEKQDLDLLVFADVDALHRNCERHRTELGLSHLHWNRHSQDPGKRSIITLFFESDSRKLPPLEDDERGPEHLDLYVLPIPSDGNYDYALRKHAKGHGLGLVYYDCDQDCLLDTWLTWGKLAQYQIELVSPIAIDQESLVRSSLSVFLEGFFKLSRYRQKVPQFKFGPCLTDLLRENLHRFCPINVKPKFKQALFDKLFLRGHSQLLFKSLLSYQLFNFLFPFYHLNQKRLEELEDFFILIDDEIKESVIPGRKQKQRLRFEVYDQLYHLAVKRHVTRSSDRDEFNKMISGYFEWNCPFEVDGEVFNQLQDHWWECFARKGSSIAF